MTDLTSAVACANSTHHWKETAKIYQRIHLTSHTKWMTAFVEFGFSIKSLTSIKTYLAHQSRNRFSLTDKTWMLSNSHPMSQLYLRPLSPVPCKHQMDFSNLHSSLLPGKMVRWLWTETSKLSTSHLTSRRQCQNLSDFFPETQFPAH